MTKMITVHLKKDRTVSRETRAKMSASHLKRMQDPEKKEALRKASLGSPWRRFVINPSKPQVTDVPRVVQ